jgi:signal transduction histidine kinase
MRGYRIFQMKLVILLGMATLFLLRASDLKIDLFYVVERRKPADAALIAGIGEGVGAPKIVDSQQQLKAIIDAAGGGHQSTRILISDAVGKFLESNIKNVSADIVPSTIEIEALAYWGRGLGQGDGYTWHSLNKSWHLVVRPFNLGGKKNYVVLITNLDRSINVVWWNSVRGLLMTSLIICLMVGASAAIMIRSIGLIVSRVQGSQLISISGWWPLELQLLAVKFNERLQTEAAIKQELREEKTKTERMASILRHDTKSAVLAVHNMFQTMEILGTGISGIEENKRFALAARKAELAYQLVDKTSAAKTVLDLRWVAVSALFEDLAVLYNEKNVVFAPPLPSLQIFADPNYLVHRCLANIINNGLKYSKAEGAAVNVGVIVKPESLIIYIKDNGIGIESSKIGKVLNSYGIDARLNTEIEGNGLGLYGSRQVLSQHHFTLGCKSESGEGSIFYISINQELFKK